MKLARARVHNLSFSQDCARSWTACPELIPSSCLCEQVAGEHSETLNGLGRLHRCPGDVVNLWIDFLNCSQFAH